MTVNTDTSQELLERNENLIYPSSKLFQYSFPGKILYERWSKQSSLVLRFIDMSTFQAPVPYFF